jgi:parvulin-like peptidyl-prolyl isomerase
MGENFVNKKLYASPFKPLLTGGLGLLLSLCACGKKPVETTGPDKGNSPQATTTPSPSRQAPLATDAATAFSTKQGRKELEDIKSLSSIDVSHITKSKDASVICLVEGIPLTVSAFRQEYRTGIISLQGMLGLDPRKVMELLYKAQEFKITLTDQEKAKLLETAKRPSSLEGKTYEQFLKGKKISAKDFETQVYQLGLAFKTGTKIIESQLLSEMINRQLILNEAKRLGYYKPAFNHYLELKRTKKFNEYLEKTNQTPEQVREEIIKQDMLEMALEHVAKDALVSDALLEKEYNANQKAFQHGPRIRIAQIVVAAPKFDNPPMESMATQLRKEHPKATQQELENLEKLTRQQQANSAAELLERALKGEDFKTLADNYSDDPQTRAEKNGGDLGFIEVGTTASSDLNKVIEAARQLKVGEVAKNVLETNYGYHVVKLIGKEEGGIRPFSEVKTELKSLVAQNNKQQAQLSWVRNKRKTADIVLSKDFLQNISPSQD